MDHTNEQQLFFMRAAICEGERGRVSAPPNPWVGCLIVKEGEVVGRGFHEKAGSAHAEVAALEQAKERAKGATAYVTLEPCAHYGRTPPCTEALIAAGVKRVVIPFLDPDATSLSGVKQLEAAGVEVIVGVGRDEAQKSLAPYLHHRKTKMPYCICKSATSIDGCMTAQDGTSKWITSKMARDDARALRAQCQAILVGVQTAIDDKPRLTAAGSPLRVVLDRTGRLPEEGPLFDPDLGPTLIFTASSRRWKHADSCQVNSLQEALLELGRRGVMQLFVEGGPKIHSEFLKQDLIHKWVIYLGNCFLGEGKRQSLGSTSMEGVKRLQLESVTSLGNDVRLIYTKESP
ncbi:MAG: Riboflavin biosynthesis protein RibD [Chlamydiales bacterium]|nr:Riboflavin biosynthesis protein RibD [Chlamydiales bacterium]MCH9635712.1 Riboflavin biosynthesis protein RibD [Chlamydiales bacterium]MCH9703553.1 bifunctional diaminohydroxyphosphoribosylaminopyrimidine deaminase/5-amino-6-(5-phosphoribosylamino)uracil reductase RibD [Chlamydiota bacterium]